MVPAGNKPDSLAQERASAAAELRKSAAWLDGVLQSAMDAIITVDEGQVIAIFNPAAEQMFGYLAAEVTGGPLERLIPERFRGVHGRHVDRFASAGVPTRRMGGLTEVTGRRRDGVEFPIEASISRTATDGGRLLTVILRDMTGRKAVERALRESAQRYQRLVELVPDALWIERDGIISFANEACVELLEVPSVGDVLGRSPLEFLHPEFHAAALGRRTALLAAQQGNARMEMKVLRPTGEAREVSVSETTFQDEGRVAIIAVLHDITDQKRAQAQTQESREQLRELSAALQNVREEEKASMARELHDELGQALTGMKMDLAEIVGDLTEAQTEARARAADMKALIDATVATVRRIARELRPLMLDDLGLVSTMEWLAKDFAKRTGIAVDLVHPGADFVADPQTSIALFRILQETLTNVARHAQARRVRVQLSRSAHELSLSIEDDGKGLPPGRPGRPKTFGLLGMRERAAMLGGNLEIQSQENAGTCIRVTIPWRGTGEPRP